jgi:hypothetical protein
MATITTTATTICTTCSAPFPSKTKLFQHIKMKNIDGTLSKCNIEAQKNGVILKDHIYSKSSEKVIIFFGWNKRQSSSQISHLLQDIVSTKYILSNANRAISDVPIDAASIDCLVVPIKYLNMKPSTLLNQRIGLPNGYSLQLYGISSPVPHYFNLRKRCYRKEITVLLPLSSMYTEDSDFNPMEAYQNMKLRQKIRDSKQLMHREHGESNEKLGEKFKILEKKDNDILSTLNNQKYVQFFQKLKKVCKLFVGRHDYFCFIDGGLPNKGLQYVREILSFQNTGEIKMIEQTEKSSSSSSSLPGSSNHKGNDFFLKLKFSVDRRSPGLLERILGTTIAIMRNDLPPSVVTTALHEPPIFKNASSSSTFSSTPSSTSTSTVSSTSTPSEETREKKKFKQDASCSSGSTNENKMVNKPPILVNLPKIPIPFNYVSKLYMDHINGEIPWKLYENDIINYSFNSIEKYNDTLTKQLLAYLNDPADDNRNKHLNNYKSSCEHIKLQITNYYSNINHITSSLQSLPSLSPPPNHYIKVLSLLRLIDQNGKWPKTSTNRQKVIESTFENGGYGGSFSMGSFMGTKHNQECSSNVLFPKLLKEIFLLENILYPNRKSSTVAINKHATFLPHVDSGAGAGQGVSLIVGLGDYYGGSLMIEGVEHNIRYSPIEFNGWNERHWTNKFNGERYSLVWFTPVGCEGVQYV